MIQKPYISSLDRPEIPDHNDQDPGQATIGPVIPVHQPDRCHDDQCPEEFQEKYPAALVQDGATVDQADNDKGR